MVQSLPSFAEGLSLLNDAVVYINDGVVYINDPVIYRENKQFPPPLAGSGNHQLHCIEKSKLIKLVYAIVGSCALPHQHFLSA